MFLQALKVTTLTNFQHLKSNKYAYQQQSKMILIYIEIAALINY